MRGPGVRFANVGLSLGGTAILEGVTFDIQPGEIHCIVGPNGGGKTSLVRSLLGEMPVSGEIAIAWNGGSHTIGYVPQALDLDRTLPVTVNDFLAMIRQRRPAFFGLAARHRQEVAGMLDRVGLAGKGARKLGDLSGGERQRLLLAQALMPQPALLVLDEPLTAMDEAGMRLFEDIVLAVADEGVTVVWIAHDLPQVRRMADRVTCLNRTVRFHGAPDEVLTPARIAEVFGFSGVLDTKGELAEAAP
jgi:zinc transport system ATP-binding protein